MCISYTKFAIFLSFAFYSCTCSMGEVPGYGSNQSYSCSSQPQPQQWGIQAMSMNYRRAHGNARSLTHLVRPGINPASSWIPFIFASTVPQKEPLEFAISFFFNFFIFPLYSKGVRLSLHVYITITFFPPPFVLLQHEYLDKVLNAIQQDLLVNLF